MHEDDSLEMFYSFSLTLCYTTTCKLPSGKFCDTVELKVLTAAAEAGSSYLWRHLMDVWRDSPLGHLQLLKMGNSWGAANGREEGDKAAVGFVARHSGRKLGGRRPCMCSPSSKVSFRFSKLSFFSHVI